MRWKFEMWQMNVKCRPSDATVDKKWLHFSNCCLDLQETSFTVKKIACSGRKSFIVSFSVLEQGIQPLTKKKKRIQPTHQSQTLKQCRKNSSFKCAAKQQRNTGARLLHHTDSLWLSFIILLYWGDRRSLITSQTFPSADDYSDWERWGAVPVLFAQTIKWEMIHSFIAVSGCRKLSEEKGPGTVDQDGLCEMSATKYWTGAATTEWVAQADWSVVCGSLQQLLFLYFYCSFHLSIFTSFFFFHLLPAWYCWLVWQPSYDTTTGAIFG